MLEVPGVRPHMCRWFADARVCSGIRKTVPEIAGTERYVAKWVGTNWARWKFIAETLLLPAAHCVRSKASHDAAVNDSQKRGVPVPPRDVNMPEWSISFPMLFALLTRWQSTLGGTARLMTRALSFACVTSCVPQTAMSW